MLDKTTSDLLRESIAAVKKASEEEAEKSKAAAARPMETRRLYIIRNVIINTPLFAWQKSRNWMIMRAVQLKVIVLVRWSRLRRWYWAHKQGVQMWVAGYRKISADDFLKEFPPKPGHKACRAGQGWMVVQLPNKQKVIKFCTCVTDKYKASGKKYLVKQPGEEETKVFKFLGDIKRRLKAGFGKKNEGEK